MTEQNRAETLSKILYPSDESTAGKELRLRQEYFFVSASLQDLVQPEVGLWLLSTMFGGLDLSGYPLDEPLPDLPESNAEKGRMKVLTEMAAREKLTLRQLYLRNAPARGHCVVMGTPAGNSRQSLATPEPFTSLLFASGLFGLGLWSRRKNNR